MAKTKKTNSHHNGNGNHIYFKAKNNKQKELFRNITNHSVTIFHGPAGTAKTHISVVYGMQELLKGNYERIVLTRPCVEAYGENLGFLPGDFNEKIAPYMMPLFDIMANYISYDAINEMIRKNKIQTIPLAFQRGITFNNSYVIADEFQNTAPDQVRMFLTRMGENCKIVMTGDLSQNDINGVNGLQDAIDRLQDIDEISIVETFDEDVVRHPLVKQIDNRYKASKKDLWEDSQSGRHENIEDHGFESLKSIK